MRVRYFTPYAAIAQIIGSRPDQVWIFFQASCITAKVTHFTVAATSYNLKLKIEYLGGFATTCVPSNNHHLTTFYCLSYLFLEMADGKVCLIIL